MEATNLVDRVGPRWKNARGLHSRVLQYRVISTSGIHPRYQVHDGNSSRTISCMSFIKDIDAFWILLVDPHLGHPYSESMRVMDTPIPDPNPDCSMSNIRYSEWESMSLIGALD